MNKYFNLGILAAALAAGCASDLAAVGSSKPAQDSVAEQKDPNLCEEVSLQSGRYVSWVNSKEEIYTVTMEGNDLNSSVCKLVLHSNLRKSERNEYALYDISCNNKVDSVENAFLRLSYPREVLVKTGHAELFDSLLKQAQGYVCPKNNAEFVFIRKEFEEIRKNYTEYR